MTKIQSNYDIFLEKSRVTKALGKYNQAFISHSIRLEIEGINYEYLYILRCAFDFLVFDEHENIAILTPVKRRTV